MSGKLFIVKHKNMNELFVATLALAVSTIIVNIQRYGSTK